MRDSWKFLQLPTLMYKLFERFHTSFIRFGTFSKIRAETQIFMMSKINQIFIGTKSPSRYGFDWYFIFKICKHTAAWIWYIQPQWIIFIYIWWKKYSVCTFENMASIWKKIFVKKLLKILEIGLELNAFDTNLFSIWRNRQIWPPPTW